MQYSMKFEMLTQKTVPNPVLRKIVGGKQKWCSQTMKEKKNLKEGLKEGK